MVVELKRGLVSRNAVAQVLSYMASVEEDLPGRGRPLGILVGNDMDSEAQGILRRQEDVRFISLAELNFKNSVQVLSRRT